MTAVVPIGYHNGRPVHATSGLTDITVEFPVDGDVSIKRASSTVIPQPQPTGFFADIKRGFGAILTALGIVFNISQYDDSQYLQFQNELGIISEKAEEETRAGNGSDLGTLSEDDLDRAIKSNAERRRIEYLYLKSMEAVEYGRRQKAEGLDPWTGMPENVGVPMSEKQAYYAGTSPRQRYFYNLSIKSKTNAWLRNHTVRKNKDVDDTQKGKAMDPEDTARVQAEEVTYWLELVSHLSAELGVKERHITARGMFPTRNFIRPVGENPEVISPAILNGCIEEVGGGRSLLLQEQAHERMSFNTFNSSVIQDPNDFLQVSNKVLKVTEIFNFLSSPNAPRINNKTFLEAYADLVDKRGCSVFELKSIPKYLLETIRATREDVRSDKGEVDCLAQGAVHQKHYIRICRYKQEEVDDALQRDRNLTEEQAWINFGERVRKDVDAGVKHWREVDRIQRELNALLLNLKRVKNLDKPAIDKHDSVIRLRADLEKAKIPAIEHIRLPGADKIPQKGSIDFYKYISQKSLENNPGNYNPQAFYQLCKQAELVTIVVHNYDNNETPVEGFFEERKALYEQFGNLPEVRRYISCLNMMSPDQTNRYNPDLVHFTKIGRRKFIDEGAVSYLNWRMLQHLMHHYKADDLKNIQLFGHNVFDISNPKELSFSKEFLSTCEHYRKPEGDDVKGYLNFLSKNLVITDAQPLLKMLEIIPTFLPPDDEARKHFALSGITQSQDEMTLSELEDEANKVRADVRADLEVYNLFSTQPCFYPNEMFIENSSPAFDKDKYCYHPAICLFRKGDNINQHGQYYEEDGPNVPKSKGLLGPDKVIVDDVVQETAGDSKADIPMHAKDLLEGGYIDIVFNKIRSHHIWQEMKKQRIALHDEYLKNGGNGYYQLCRQKLSPRNSDGTEIVQNGYSVLRPVIKDFPEGRKEFCAKILAYDGEQPLYEAASGDELVKDLAEAKLYTEEQLFREMDLMYHERMIEHESTEAFARREAEIYGHALGVDIEFDRNELKAFSSRLNSSESCEDPREKAFLRILEDRKRGFILPDEAPSFCVYREWWGRDKEGAFKVYRSRSFNGELVIQRYELDNSPKPLQLFAGNESDLANLTRYDYALDEHSGKYIRVNAESEVGRIIGEALKPSLDSLSDHIEEHAIVQRHPKVDGVFAGGILKSVLGEKNLKWLVGNLPKLFNVLVKYSGRAVGLGGLIRFMSPLFGNWAEGIYNTGYKLSNWVRGIAAFAGALRGQLNVHKFHNITIGEITNMIASATPNGIKHVILGIGNLFLFVGRAQQAELRTQKNNAHIEAVAKGKIKIHKPEELTLHEADARPPARVITRMVTGVINSVKHYAQISGLGSTVSSVVGSMAGAILASIQMLKDVFHDPRLIFQFSPRMSEKSGETFRAIPSPGHLLNLVGVISGLSAAFAGTVGRSESLGGRVGEDGVFNKWGRWATSLATLAPVPGIVANAIDVLNNQQGYSKTFRSLNGEDMHYNPVRAGLCQILGAVGIGVSSLGDLSNKYVAAGFDIANGFYYEGAAEEEVINCTTLSLSQERRGQVLYNQPFHLKLIDFAKYLMGDKNAAA